MLIVSLLRQWIDKIDVSFYEIKLKPVGSTIEK